MTLKFEPVTLERQTAYNALLDRCSEIASDYSFVNIWGWASEYDLTWAWEADLVWIRQEKPAPILWAPVGRWDQENWPQRIAALEVGDRIFTRVPQKLKEIWQGQFTDDMIADSQRGQWDYLYSVEELAALKGNRFHKKKNLVNQFLKNYEHTYHPMDASMVEAALGLQMDWCTWRDCESIDVLAAENRVIEKVLRNWNDLHGLIGGVLTVGERLAAYTVGQRLDRETLVIHFEKGNPEFKGVYQAINRMFLSRIRDEFTLANREQDLDDPGLRKAKESYHPVGYLKKYRAKLP